MKSRSCDGSGHPNNSFKLRLWSKVCSKDLSARAYRSWGCGFRCVFFVIKHQLQSVFLEVWTACSLSIGEASLSSLRSDPYCERRAVFSLCGDSCGHGEDKSTFIGLPTRGSVFLRVPARCRQR